MNPANATSLNSSNSITGQGATYGNAFPMFGTGSVVYAQCGYLLPKNILPSGQLMPYVAYTMAKYDRLGNLNMNLFNAGVNWLIKGHNAKLSLDWQNRPTYFINSTADLQLGKRKNAFILQYQIFI